MNFETDQSRRFIQNYQYQGNGQVPEILGAECHQRRALYDWAWVEGKIDGVAECLISLAEPEPYFRDCPDALGNYLLHYFERLRVENKVFEGLLAAGFNTGLRCRTTQKSIYLVFKSNSPYLNPRWRFERVVVGQEQVLSALNNCPEPASFTDDPTRLNLDPSFRYDTPDMDHVLERAQQRLQRTLTLPEFQLWLSCSLSYAKANPWISRPSYYTKKGAFQGRVQLLLPFWSSEPDVGRPPEGALPADRCNGYYSLRTFLDVPQARHGARVMGRLEYSFLSDPFGSVT